MKMVFGVVEKAERIDSNKELALHFGENERQIRRYIRLTYLIPKILDIVDEGKIAFTVGVELSYLKEEEQYELCRNWCMENRIKSKGNCCR